MATEKIRSFIAIPLTEDFSESLMQCECELKKYLRDPKIRWIAPENRHITLKFLGDTEPSMLSKLQLSLAQNLQEVSLFPLLFNKFSWLPSATHPHVLTGVFHLDGSIADIYSRVNHICSTFNIKKDKRPFLPHVTVARIRGRKDYKKFSLDLPIKLAPLLVTKLNLYQSSLDYSPPKYVILKRIYFKGLNPILKNAN